MAETEWDNSVQSTARNEQTSTVTILGLGNMGSAMAQALLNDGRKVIVWNRTTARAEPLIASGATLASSPAEAVAASPLTIMCVLDNESANAILNSPGVAAAFAGRTLVQLTIGVPDEVSAQQAWITKRGGNFIAGGILVFPSGIGKPNTLIVYAGDGPSFEANRAVLSGLGGTPHYLGTDPRTAVGVFFTLVAYGAGALNMFFETAAIARVFGLDIETYHGLARNITDVILLDGMSDGARRVESGNFADSLASLDLGLASIEGAVSAFQQTGIPTVMTQALAEQLRLARVRGDGSKDVAQVVETLWTQRNKASAPTVPD